MAVPLFVRRSNSVLDGDGQTELFGQGSGQCGVAGDRPVYLAMAGQSELEADSEAVEWRVTGTDETHTGDHLAEAAQFMVVLR